MWHFFIFRLFSCGLQCDLDPNCIAINFIWGEPESFRFDHNFKSTCKLAAYGHTWDTGDNCPKKVVYGKKICSVPT